MKEVLKEHEEDLNQWTDVPLLYVHSLVTLNGTFQPHCNYTKLSFGGHQGATHWADGAERNFLKELYPKPIFQFRYECLQRDLGAVKVQQSKGAQHALRTPLTKPSSGGSYRRPHVRLRYNSTPVWKEYPCCVCWAPLIRAHGESFSRRLD